MTWSEPHHNHLYLTLPVLQESRLPQPPILSTEPPVAIPYDDVFLSAWTHTLGDSISDTLPILGAWFGKLAVAGQSLVPVSYKSSPDDLVTDMDRGIEMLFRIWLNAHYPSHKVIGEEGHKATISSEDYVWYVDPIDGTTNFSNGKSDVSMHFGCIKDGRPWFSMVVFPYWEKVYYGFEDQLYCIDTIHLESPKQVQGSYHKDLIVGTEFLPKWSKDIQRYEVIRESIGAQAFRKKSIGVNLFGLLNGESRIFYKPQVKFWDIIAPLGLIDACYGDQFCIRLYIPTPNGELSSSNFRCISPFSCDAEFVDYLNARHKDNCRTGFILAAPQEDVDGDAVTKLVEIGLDYHG